MAIRGPLTLPLTVRSIISMRRCGIFTGTYFELENLYKQEQHEIPSGSIDLCPFYFDNFTLDSLSYAAVLHVLSDCPVLKSGIWMGHMVGVLTQQWGGAAFSGWQGLIWTQHTGHPV